MTPLLVLMTGCILMFELAVVMVVLIAYDDWLREKTWVLLVDVVFRVLLFVTVNAFLVALFSGGL